jgi:inosine-uridine nucleoside N-ribohydrolase
MKAWQPNSLSSIAVVSDPGLDDLLAFALLSKLVPKAPKQIVSTFGNMPAAVTTQNTQDFVGLADSSWSYRVGADRPFKGTIIEPWMDRNQGASGLWNIQPDVRKSIPTSREALSTRQVISLATLTDVKQLMEDNPVDELLIMGGVFDRFEENGNPAELNIRYDVEAAKWVFENCSQTAVKVVPAEVAFDVSWTRSTVESIPETTPLNWWLKKLLCAGYDTGRYVNGNELYDPLAIFLGFYPSFALWRNSGIEIVDSGKKRGQSYLTDQNPPCYIAVRVRDPQLVANLLFQLIFLDEML